MTDSTQIARVDIFKSQLPKAIETIYINVPDSFRALMTQDRLKRQMLSLVLKNKLLSECTPTSIFSSVSDSVKLGLDFSGGALGQAYLVPYRNNKGSYDAQLIIGYRGFIELARRSGQIKSIECHTVHKNDKFEIAFGLTPKLDHTPCLTGDRGEFVAVYCIAEFSNGTKQVEVMTASEVEAIRKRSRSRDNGPWTTDFLEMAKKTCVRRASKYWPMTIELAEALNHEELVESSSNQEFVDLSQDSGFQDANFEEVKQEKKEDKQVNKLLAKVTKQEEQAK